MARSVLCCDDDVAGWRIPTCHANAIRERETETERERKKQRERERE